MNREILCPCKQQIEAQLAKPRGGFYFSFQPVNPPIAVEKRRKNYFFVKWDVLPKEMLPSIEELANKYFQLQGVPQLRGDSWEYCKVYSLRAKSRKGKYADARFYFIYLCEVLSYGRICKSLLSRYLDKDRSMVYYGIEKIQSYLEIYKECAEYFVKLVEEVCKPLKIVNPLEVNSLNNETQQIEEPTTEEKKTSYPSF